MKILVTGGTGVIGAGLVPELLSRGHEVRILSRNADEDAKRWPGAEAVTGDVSDKHSLRGTCATCDAVIHVAGIGTEHPPDITFASVNVEGTRHILTEAQRSNVRRFVFVSSLGADTGSSDYHRSKREAESLVRESTLAWTIVRPGNVYGPGDEVISNILKMVRVLPAIPMIDDGEQPFQPIWYEDLGKALAILAQSDDQAGAVVEVAGPEVTSLRDLLRRFADLTGREPFRVRVPMPFASLATKVASRAVDIPFDDTKLTLLRENNVLDNAAENPLVSLGIEPTPLSVGLARLADEMPEQMPEEGVEPMQHKRFWATIAGSPHSAASLMTLFRDRVTELMPIEFASEPSAPTRIEKGATMTGSIPLRGHFQVRVEVCEPTRVVFATIEGHPLAGIVEFSTRQTQGGVTFEIEIYTRAANVLDLMAVSTVGEAAQSANWATVVQNVIDASGGSSDGVHTHASVLDEQEAERIEQRVRTIVQSRQRKDSADSERAAQG